MRSISGRSILMRGIRMHSIAGRGISGHGIRMGSIRMGSIAGHGISGHGICGHGISERESVRVSALPYGTVPDRTVSSVRVHQAQQLGEEPPQLGIVQRVAHHNNSCTAQPCGWYSHRVIVAMHNSQRWAQPYPRPGRNPRRRAGAGSAA
jgi:hypothetical protein